MHPASELSARETATAFNRAGIHAAGGARVCDACVALAPVHIVRGAHQGVEVHAHICTPCLSRRLVHGDTAVVTRAFAARAVKDRVSGRPAVPVATDWRAQTAALRRQTEALRRRPAAHSQHARGAGAR